MHRIDTPFHSSNLFTEGEPGVTPATELSGDWLNDLQETIAQFIESRGGTLAKGTYTQLQDAVSGVSIQTTFSKYLDPGNAQVILWNESPASTDFFAGFQGGSAGRVLTFVNLSAEPYFFENEEGTTPAQDIITGVDSSRALLVDTGQSIAFIYDSTASRWRALGTPYRQENQTQTDNRGGAVPNFGLGIEARIIRLTLSSAVTLSGIANGYQGRVVHVINDTAGTDLTLSVEDTNSDAANRILAGNDVVLTLYDAATLVYDDDPSLPRWRVVGISKA